MLEKMPAKKRNDPRYKSFVGRLFTLRNHKIIPVSREEQGDRFEMKLEQLGQAVLVLDETNTRVKVCVAEGGFAWMPKFYLHKEIKNGEFKNADSISESIQELLSLAEVIKTEADEIGDGKNIKKDKLETYSEELCRLANNLRQYADIISPTSGVKIK